LIEPVIHRLRADGALGYLPNALDGAAFADSQMGRLDTGRAAAAEAADLAAGTGNALMQ
jgi:hypothetical protein